MFTVRLYQLRQRHELGGRFPHFQISPISLRTIIGSRRPGTNELPYLLHFHQLPLQLGPRRQRHQERNNHRLSFHSYRNWDQMSSQLFLRVPNNRTVLLRHRTTLHPQRTHQNSHQMVHAPKCTPINKSEVISIGYFSRCKHRRNSNWFCHSNSLCLNIKRWLRKDGLNHQGPVLDVIIVRILPRSSRHITKRLFLRITSSKPPKVKLYIRTASAPWSNTLNSSPPSNYSSPPNSFYYLCFLLLQSTEPSTSTAHC